MYSAVTKLPSFSLIAFPSFLVEVGIRVHVRTARAW